MRNLLYPALMFLCIGCDKVGEAENEFIVTSGFGGVGKFLVERHTGCTWAIVPEIGDMGPLKSSYTVEEFQQLAENQESLFLDAKKYGRFEIVSVKSANSDFCNKSFGLTRSKAENAKK